MHSVMTEENLILKKVIGGKLHKKSLVFHFQCDNVQHQFHIKQTYAKSLSLRLVLSL